MDGEHIDCGCGMWTCKKIFMKYTDMTYDHLLFLATERKIISWRERPTFIEVIGLLQANKAN